MVVVVGISATVVLATGLVRFSRSPIVLPVLPPSPPVYSAARPFFFNGTFRPVYRHSIVPGGVYSAEEVQAAILRDPVVAAHYAKLDSATVVGAVLEQPRAVYVSYRVGHRTLWTSSKVVLPAGEALLTDGTRVVRARCGNLVSETGGEREQGVADASGERFDPEELDQQLPAPVARGPEPIAAAPQAMPLGVLPGVGGTPVVLAAGGPEFGPLFQPVAGALPFVLGGVEPTSEPFATTTGTVPPTTTSGVIVLPPTTTTGTVLPTTTTTTTGTVPPTTTTGLIEPPTATTEFATLAPTITTFSPTSGSVPEPSSLAMLVLAWAAYRYRRRPR